MKKKQVLAALEYLDKLSQNDYQINDAVQDLMDFANEYIHEDEAAPITQSVGEFLVTSEAKELNAYTVYSDGACRGNPGPGSWGVVGQDVNGVVLFEQSEFHPETTNNRMELLGATKALEYMIRHLADEKKPQSTAVILYSDSKYVIDGYEKWLPNWKARGWKKADKKEPENLDLWQKFDFIAAKFKNLSFRWVKGHSGHPQNERCDQLANQILDDNLNI